MRNAIRHVAVLVVGTALLGASPAPIVEPQALGAAWTADGIAKLDADLDAMLASDAALRGAHYGMYAIDTSSGMPLYARAVDDEIQPASTFKLVVGSAALDKLGPAFRFTTYAANGGRRGFELIGGDDPTLAVADVDAAARALRDGGVTTVDRIDLDAGRYRAQDAPVLAYPEGWTWDDFGQDYAPQVSDLTIDENLAHVVIRPSQTAGSWARASVDSSAVFGDRTVACEPHARSVPQLVSLVRTGAADSADTVDAGELTYGCPIVRGSIPLGSAPESLEVSVDPRAHAYAVVARSLAKAGVTVTHDAAADSRLIPYVASPDAARAEAKTIVWTHASSPLSTLLGPRFWIPSNNLFGELLLRRLGTAEPVDGSRATEAGIAYERTWLRSIGVDPTTVTLADGCGMSQYDRITPRDLVTVLQHDWNGPNRQLVLDSLPIGGARGTIEGIAGTDAAGRVFAKTGSMMHVRGLAGYLAPLHHGAITFAFQVDDWNGDYPSLAALRARMLSRLIDD